MTTYFPPYPLNEVEQAWRALQAQVPLRPIRNAADFEHVRGFADALADSVGDDETHPLYSLFELTMQLIEHWEDAHLEMPIATPREVLRHLLETNNLEHKDLSDIASPTLISDVLAGRRDISKRLAKALALRFHIDIAAFS